MAITYEFVFRDGGSGSTPTSSNTIATNPGQAGSAGSVDLPQSQPPPPTTVAQAGSVTAEQVKEIVNRAADRQSEQRPTPPASGQQAPTEQSTTIPVTQRDAGQAPPTIPASPPTQPRPAAGEATIDAIRESVERSGGRDSDRQAPATPASQGSDQGGKQGQWIEIPVYTTPQQAPASAQGPAMPQQAVGQMTPQVINNYVQQVQQPAAPGQRPLPEHPDLPSLKDLPPIPEHQPPTQPPLTPDQRAMKDIANLLSQAGGAAGVPGSGNIAALAGMSGATAAVSGAIGIAGLAGSAYMKELATLGSYSPDVARVQAQQDVKEQMRLIEQARQFGEQDARTAEFWGNVGRSGWQGTVTLGRKVVTGEVFYQNALKTAIETLNATISEFRREVKGQNISPLEQFKQKFAHVPDPPLFTGGSTIFESNNYDAVVTGL